MINSRTIRIYGTIRIYFTLAELKLETVVSYKSSLECSRIMIKVLITIIELKE